MLSLQSLLSRFTLLLSLLLENGQLAVVAILLFIDLDLGRDQVLLDALDHVFVLALLHQLEVRGFLDLVLLLL